MRRNLIIKFFSAIIIFALNWNCRSLEDVDAQPDQAVENDLKIIRESYNPPACLQARFQINIRAGRESKKADGRMTADTKEDRMHIVLTDSVFGMQVSEVIVSDGQVYVKNAGEDARILPLGDFELSGIGNNSIYLPFALFQDLMFGRIPQSVFNRRNQREKTDGSLQVRIKDDQESFEYLFRSNRLVSLSYLKSDSGDRIEATMQGNISNTVFPEKMELKGGKGETLRDEMRINFRKISPLESCPLSEFQIP